jgi:hypothetical protein
MPATPNQAFVAASKHRRLTGSASLAPLVTATVPTLSFGTLTQAKSPISTTIQAKSSDAGPLPRLSNTKLRKSAA